MKPIKKLNFCKGNLYFKAIYIAKFVVNNVPNTNLNS